MTASVAGKVAAFSITSQDVSPTADLPSSCVRHIFKPSTDFGLSTVSTPVAADKMVYVASGVGTIKGFHGLVNESGSSASITMDLKKNGASILSAPITITNSTGDMVPVDGVLTSTALTSDDVLTVVLAVSSSTGMQGPFAWVVIEEVSVTA